MAASRALATVLCVPAIVAGCTGDIGFAAGAGSQRIEAGGDVFFVSIREDEILLRNFATGTHNQSRLYANAQSAIGMATGCEYSDFRQVPDLNIYTATLRCVAVN